MGKDTAASPAKNVRRLGHYGRVVRKLRIDQDMNLRQMAEKVGLSSAFISAIEKGDKPAPKHLVDKVIQCLGLPSGGQQQRDLEEAIMLDRGYVTVSLVGASAQAKDVALRFARSLEHLDDKQLSEVLSICRNPSVQQACQY